jgi:undecaprenyl-diphosphatase
MGKINPKTIVHSIVAFVALLLILANTTLVRSVDVFGSPFFFAIGLLAELLLFVVFVYSLIWALRTPLRILGSILLSAWGGILTNPYVKRIRKTESPIYKWAVARLNPKNPFGLILTIGAVVALYFFVGFSNVLQAVWFHEPLTRIDTRVVNLMPSIRTPLQTSFFRFVTFTANTESILLLILLASGILWRKRQKFAISLLLFALVAEEGSAFLLKHLVGRVRPAQSLSLIKEDSFSFPSGHVLRATVLFGFLSYLLFRSIKSSLFRIGIILGYVVAVALVALSRVYLGVHYPSDVLASILFGASLLTLLITLVEITIRYRLWGQSLKRFTNKLLGAVPGVIVIVSLIVSPVLIKITPVTANPTFATLSAINETTVKKLPLFSETLTGKTMEPINFIYVGSQQQIEQLFLSHGWYKADPSTLSNTLKALSVGF